MPRQKKTPVPDVFRVPEKPAPTETQDGPTEVSPATLAITMDDVRVLVFGPGTWGRGLTLEEALVNAQRPSRFICYLVHRDAEVDVLGRILSPVGATPRELFRKPKTLK